MLPEMNFRINCQVYLNKESLKSSSVLFQGGFGGGYQPKELVSMLTEKLEVTVLLIGIKPLSNHFKRMPL